MKSLEEIKDAIKRITVEENRPLKGNKGPLKQVLEGLLDIVNGLNEETSSKQDELVSGENIKTINGQSILGEGDLIPNGMVETTWAELKELRDNAQLVPGTMYRITDYMTTTAQADTRSAGHQFDIIVTALTESVLSEDAKAIQHKFSVDDMPKDCWSLIDGEVCNLAGEEIINNTSYAVYLYGDDKYYINPQALVFGEDYGDDEYFGYMYGFIPDYCDYGDGIIDGEGYLIFKEDLREFSYFSNSNLAAWKLKYCLDNDESRFAWAQNDNKESIVTIIGSSRSGPGANLYRQPHISPPDYAPEGYIYAWGTQKDVQETDNDNSCFVFSKTPLPKIGETVFAAEGDEYDTVIQSFSGGKGVIYQMIDEYNNNVPYDFKNIQFSWSSDKLTNYFDDPTDNKYLYTFTWVNKNDEVEDSSIIWPSLHNDEDGTDAVRDNYITAFYEALPEKKLILTNNIIIYGYYTEGNFYYGCQTLEVRNSVNNLIGLCYGGTIILSTDNHFKDIRGGMCISCSASTIEVVSDIYINNEKINS